MCYCPTPTLHLNLALTGDGAFLFSLKKTHSVWFISVLNYGDTENVLINHLLLVIPMSYPCHYTNLCPHKPHKHAHTHTHTHTHTHNIYILYMKKIHLYYISWGFNTYFWSCAHYFKGTFLFAQSFDKTAIICSTSETIFRFSGCHQNLLFLISALQPQTFLEPISS